MSAVLGEILGFGVYLYLDDILICGAGEEEILSNFLTVLMRLDAANLRINAAKSIIGVTELPMLGYIVNNEGIRMISDRIADVLRVPMPRTPKELRRFFGMTNYMRGFIPNYGVLAAPLTSLVTASRTLLQSPEAIQAF